MTAALTADVVSARRGPCASPIGSESRSMRNDSVESAGSVEYSTGGNTECGRTSCGADDWDPHADDFLHVTTGKQARAAAMRCGRYSLSPRVISLIGAVEWCVCVLWCASKGYLRPLRRSVREVRLLSRRRAEFLGADECEVRSRRQAGAHDQDDGYHQA